MRDGMEARFWADHSSHYAESVIRLLKGFGALIQDFRVAMERLNEIEFDAPWRRPESRQRTCE